ncbi:PREDICTED: paramyosin-like [Priapulus caudatus]|uniref:Paramyosin-like n=1 Tax=Priapulus caudatus TaxID=37621 RepID=A0ABM1F6N6_PRICU|nr:PREDICTED: paramyosin-like [Priapulus caudatus]
MKVSLGLSQIERQRADLSLQLVELNDRLDDADSVSVSQVELNRKRDTELSKLRKLLDDIHVENEESTVGMRRKHSDTVAELNEQIEMLSKSKNK